tara:strand:+ start:634 stop:954 length:321 start_codon:yes stop_codon:yes gene_type:complete
MNGTFNVENIVLDYGLSMGIFLFMLIGSIGVSCLIIGIILFYYSKENNMKYILTMIGVFLFILFIDSFDFSIGNNYIIINALVSIVGAILGLGMAAVVFLTALTKA